MYSGSAHHLSDPSSALQWEIGMPIEATGCQLFRGLLVHAAEGKFSKADNVKAFAHCMRHGVVPCREDFNVALLTLMQSK